MGAAVDAKRDEWRRKAAMGVLRLVAREGVEAASMRNVASELGCTTGALTHYFRDKAELIEVALDLVLSNVGEQFKRLTEPGVSLKDLSAVLEALVSGDADSETFWKAWLAMTSASLFDPHLMREQARRYRSFQSILADCLGRLRDRNILPGVVDPKSDAAHLSAFIDGLGVQAMIDPAAFKATRRVQLVRSYLSRLTTRPDR